LVLLGEKSGDHLCHSPHGTNTKQWCVVPLAMCPTSRRTAISRYGGVIAGGMFLREFAKDLGIVLWMHIDMARAWLQIVTNFWRKVLPAPRALPARVYRKYG